MCWNIFQKLTAILVLYLSMSVEIFVHAMKQELRFVQEEDVTQLPTGEKTINVKNLRLTLTLLNSTRKYVLVVP